MVCRLKRSIRGILKFTQVDFASIFTNKFLTIGASHTESNVEIPQFGAHSLSSSLEALRNSWINPIILSALSMVGQQIYWKKVFCAFCELMVNLHILESRISLYQFETKLRDFHKKVVTRTNVCGAVRVNSTCARKPCMTLTHPTDLEGQSFQSDTFEPT